MNAKKINPPRFNVFGYLYCPQWMPRAISHPAEREGYRAVYARGSTSPTVTTYEVFFKNPYE